MTYMIISLVILGLMAIASAYFASRPITIVEKRQMKEMKAEELAAILIEQGKSMRYCEKSGVGIRCDGLYRVIAATNKRIEKKVKEKQPITDGEKWFYENYYLVYRFIFSKKFDMSELPHYEGEPRIVRIARLIVDNSLNDLTRERVRYLIDSVKKTIPFTYREIRALNTAIGIACIEQIYILSERLKYNDDCKKMAKNGILNKRMISSDCYLYYFINYNEVNKKTAENLARNGIDKNNVVINYNFTLMRNTSMAETLFGSLNCWQSFAPIRTCIRFLGAYGVIAETENLDNIGTETLCEYFGRIEKIAIREKVSEEYVAKKLIEFAAFNQQDISTLLFDYFREFSRFVATGKYSKIKRKTNFKMYLYNLANITFAASLATLLGVYCRSIPFGIISFVPFLLVAESIINYLLSYLKCGWVPPMMNYSKVPYEHSVMVVVSEYIGSITQLKDSIFRAKALLEGNKDENITIGLLIDTKGGKMPVSDLDREIIEHVENMSGDDGINVFLRKKSYIKDRFVAKERKRGAIMALCKLLLLREDFEFLYIRNNKFITPKYIVTLDSDNAVLPGEILRLANMMAHPYNKKYDLLAMHSRYSLFSIENHYSLGFLSGSGYETYPNYSSLYYNLFGEDVFTGKGIFRLEKFYNKLDEILPTGKILSHDILEGSILKTGCGGLCFEDAPQNFIADRERRRRWQRGDIQLLPFLLGLWKTDGGKVCRREMSPLGKFVILKNILGIIREGCIFALLLIGLCTSELLLSISFGLFLLPYIIDAIKVIRGVVNGENVKNLLRKGFTVAKNAVRDFFLLGYYAVDNILVVLSTIFKIIFNRNLLEWKTYYNSQTARDFASYVKEFSLSTLVLTGIAGMLMILGINVILLLAYIVSALGIFTVIFSMSKIGINSNCNKEEYNNKLMEIAENTYKYFCYMRNDNGLIGDNLQIKPYKGIANMTSPTNIGFSILAEICAKELNIITIDECIFNINKVLFAINSLKKWEGNLYNWYKIDNFEPVNEFVSSVDNGNLAGILMLCSQYLSEKGEEVTASLASKILREMRLDKLYDSTKKLFYIGYDGKKKYGHYDLLASESRILSMVYIALFKDYEHYSCLQKDYSGNWNNILLSWSGTMFEMLMAEILFAAPFGSNIYNSELMTAKRQLRTAYHGIWGVSESGYHNIDSDMKYQYQAFGLSDLALSAGVNGGVVSPYSSILALRFAPRDVIRNIDRMVDLGLSFEYGFYESIDFNNGSNIVYSAMSHHQGMILAAITNFLKDGILQKTIRNNVLMNNVLHYFNDIVPSGCICGKKHENRRNYYDESNNYYIKCNKIEENYIAYALTNSQYTVICNNLGGGFSKNGKIFIGKFSGIIDDREGTYFFASQNSIDWYAPTYLPFLDGYEYSIETNGREIFYHSSAGLQSAVRLLPFADGEVRKLNAAENFSQCAFYLPICMDEKDAYDSHPSFRNLFVTVIKVSDNVIILKKTFPGEKGKCAFIAVRVEGLKNIQWECNRLNYIGRGHIFKDANFLRNDKIEKSYPSFGNVLSPCVGVKGNFDSTKNECQIVIVYGSDEKSLLQTVTSLPKDMYRYAAQSAKSYILGEKAQSILGEVIYSPYRNGLLKNIVKSNKKEQFIKYTNFKKVIRYNFDESRPETIFEFIEAIVQIRMLGFETKISIYTQHELSRNIKQYIIKAFEQKNIINYSFLFGDCEEKDWNILNLSQEMHYKKKGARISEMAKVGLFSYSGTLYPVCNSEIIYKSGEGGYDTNNRYIVNGCPKMPYSHVVSDKKGGFVITSDGTSFSYFLNSRENKCVSFSNDPLCSDSGESLYIKTVNGNINILGGHGDGHLTVIEKGKYTHMVSCNSFQSTVSMYNLFDGYVRVIEVEITQKNEIAEIFYGFLPSASWRFDNTFTAFTQESDIIKINNIANGNDYWVRILGIKSENLRLCGEMDLFPYFEYCSENNSEKIYILTSCSFESIIGLNENNMAVQKYNQADRFLNYSEIEINGHIKSLDYLVNFLPYQIESSRLLGKTGFYQVGGATGFRDQLQDSLAFFSKPEIIKERIIEACKHQYEAGDVMHWWHEPKFGLRTRITDDKLFLPYVVCKYIEYTGDEDILRTEYPYLSSAELLPEEKDRFENPEYTDYTENVFLHCLRAIRSSLRYGEHRLLIMGKGDWNDGMDEVCANGVGESVFNSMFCHLVLSKFGEFCDGDLKTEMNTIATELKNAINLHAYEGDRYMRLYTDNGRWLGSERSKKFQLDLLVQAFAVLSGVADGDRAVKCLQSCEQLIDRKAGIIKLLTPALDKGEYLGYISDYPKGIRENGGQYTHAAIWYLMALTRIGKQDEAFDLFQMINPVEKCIDTVQSNMYKCEPYVLCGDIYSNEDNYGQGGWSWYTGSAGWAYKLVIEEFFGIKRRGDELSIEPNLPKKLEGYVVEYRFRSSKYIIEYRSALFKKIIVDGEICEKIKLGENINQKVVVEVGY